jgi:hypothetical protein
MGHRHGSPLKLTLGTESGSTTLDQINSREILICRQGSRKPGRRGNRRGLLFRKDGAPVSVLGSLTCVIPGMVTSSVVYANVNRQNYKHTGDVLVNKNK